MATPKSEPKSAFKYKSPFHAAAAEGGGVVSIKPGRTPAGFTNQEWNDFNPLEVKFRGMPPSMRRVDSRPYGYYMTKYLSEVKKTKSIEVMKLSKESADTLESRGMGREAIVRVDSVYKIARARATDGILGANEVDIVPDQISITPIHRTVFGGYQAQMSIRLDKTGDLELLKNHDADGNRIKLVIQQEHSSAFQSILQRMQSEDKSDEMQEAIADVRKWMIAELSYNPMS